MTTKRILIADDDPSIIKLVSVRLEADAWVVAGAPSGEDALKQMRAQPPQAAILDVQMPGGGGLAALEAIKADPALADTPVMMLTGERNPEIVMQAVGAGAADYMVKPFDPDTLARRVARMVANAAAGSSGQAWEL